MATASSVVTTALRKAMILPAEQTPSSGELSDGLETLNDMMHAWSLDGIDIGWTDVTLTDELPVPSEYLRGIKDGLAVELCPEYGKQPDQQLSAIAAKSKSDIRKSLFTLPDVEHDPTLTTHGIGYNVITD